MLSKGLNLPSDLSVEVRIIKHPPTWRDIPFTISYLIVFREVNAREVLELLYWAQSKNLINPRVITPKMAQWSSLLHPRFFASLKKDLPNIRPLSWKNNSLSSELSELTALWLQSMMFLAGVTLSAAIVQNRFSKGTIGSKLDKLWDAGTLAHKVVIPEVSELNLHQEIRHLLKSTKNNIALLFALRKLFMATLSKIAPKIGEVKLMKPSPIPLKFSDRFLFVKDLQKTLGNELQAIIVYGSSISSKNFADIDALLIVSDPIKILQKLAGTSPYWQGKELNISVYSQEELLFMQRLSGDNLADYGVCIWGEALVVQKPIANLLARNFSFGAIRQRQQFGMLTCQLETKITNKHERFNLNQYFIKIPANVAKGTLGAVGTMLPKEDIHDWLISTIDFDIDLAQQQSKNGNTIESLASSSIATGNILTVLNEKLQVACEITN